MRDIVIRFRLLGLSRLVVLVILFVLASPENYHRDPSSEPADGLELDTQQRRTPSPRASHLVSAISKADVTLRANFFANSQPTCRHLAGILPVS
jgi:hypothetical protein